MFKLPNADYSKGYQPKIRPELTGGSSPVDAKLKAANELRSWTRRLTRYGLNRLTFVYTINY